MNRRSWFAAVLTPFLPKTAGYVGIPKKFGASLLPQVYYNRVALDTMEKYFVFGQCKDMSAIFPPRGVKISFQRYERLDGEA